MIKQIKAIRVIPLPEVKPQWIWLSLLLLLAGTTYAMNMYGFPFYDNAEGTHAADAWALLEKGSLSPYTYRYETPPMGTLILALWIKFSGIAYAPEAILSSGRLLMFIVHILTVLAIYGVSRKLNLAPSTAVLAALIFGLSPLATVLQRRILVENLMTLFMLVAFYAVMGSKRTLIHYSISAFAIGMAFLSHVSAVFFFPAIIIVVFNRSLDFHRRFAIAIWGGIAVSLFMAFPLHAQLKSELFPTGMPLGGSHPHVSLLETQADRLERIASDEFLRSDSSFIHNLNIWLNSEEDSSDMVLVALGFVSVGLVIIKATFFDEKLQPFAWLVGPYCLNLITIERVFDKDIMPLLPLFAISIGVVLQTIVRLIEDNFARKEIRYGMYTAITIPLAFALSYVYVSRSEIYTVNQVDMQNEATDWISHHVHIESTVVTDNYAFVYLRLKIPNTHYYWAVDTDPDVRDKVVEDNWCNIDYLLTTPQMIEDMNENHMPLVEVAYVNSTVIQTYGNNGWPIEIRQVNQRNCNIPFP